MSGINEAPTSMKKPIKILGMAAGMATRKMRYFCPAPSVRATSRYDARVLAMLEMVSIVTGHQTASATNPTAESVPDGERTIASGTHAVAGIGPTTFNN